MSTDVTIPLLYLGISTLSLYDVALHPMMSLYDVTQLTMSLYDVTLLSMTSLYDVTL